MKRERERKMTSSSWMWWHLDRWQALFASFPSLRPSSFHFPHFGARIDVMWRRRGIKFWWHEMRRQVFDIQRWRSVYIFFLSFISILWPFLDSHYITLAERVKEVTERDEGERERGSISLLVCLSLSLLPAHITCHRSPDISIKQRNQADIWFPPFVGIGALKIQQERRWEKSLIGDRSMTEGLEGSSRWLLSLVTFVEDDEQDWHEDRT